MGSKGKSTVRQPSFDQLLEDATWFYKSLNKRSDVTIVVTSVAYLDQCLASLLEKKFVESTAAADLLTIDGPLGSFAQRSKLSYCLGLVSGKVLNNLMVVAGIRNRFAHKHLELSFDDSEVINLCDSLSFPKVRGITVNPATGKFRESKQWPPEFATTPRTKFIAVVSLLATRLTFIGMEAKPYEKMEKGW